jgi:poly-gamma-glutamate synthesis protein (capsule biosynthesis protein)
MLTRRPSRNPDERMARLVDRIRGADVSFFNLEGPMWAPGAYPIKPYGFSSYFTTESWMAEELRWMGFDLASLANNHMSDYSPESIYQNQRLLGEADIVWAGAGRNLTEARAPQYLDTPKARVALIAIDSSYEHTELIRVQMASDPYGSIPGRPGVNGMRWDGSNVVDEDTIAELKRIAASLGEEDGGKYAMLRGTPDDLHFFGSWFRAGEPTRTQTWCHPGDLASLVRWIENAAAQADYVIVSHHSHEKRGEHDDQPLDYQVELAHAAIDAGASVVLGHGWDLKGVEIYRGRPIYYDLAHFGQEVESQRRHPTDTFDFWQAPAKPTPLDLVQRRRARLGELVIAYTGVMASFAFDGDTLVRADVVPIELTSSELNHRRGTPTIAEGESAEAIVTAVARASESFGTAIRLEDGVGRIELTHDGGEVSRRRDS